MSEKMTLVLPDGWADKIKQFAREESVRLNKTVSHQDIIRERLEEICGNTEKIKGRLR